MNDQEKDRIMDETAEEWIAIGLSTEPSDETEIVAAIGEVYSCAGLSPPASVIVCGSPFEAAVLAHAKIGKDEIAEVLRARTESLRSIAKSSGMAPNSLAIYGQHDAGWLSFYDAIRRLGEDECAELSGLMRYARCAGWAWPYESAAWCSVRPRHIAFDDDGRLHNANGNAIEYPDGWGLCMWHGTMIPREWIVSPARRDAKDALTWPNIEQRRCLAEIIGWDAILDAIPHTVIDRHENPEIGTLVEADIPDSGRTRFLRVKCGTGRMFAILTSIDINTAAEANARSYRMSVEDLLKSELRT